MASGCNVRVCDFNALHLLVNCLWQRAQQADPVVSGTPVNFNASSAVQSDNQNVFTKLGPYAWLCGAVLCTEVLIIIKFGREEFTAPFPQRVKIFWGIVGAVIAAVLVGWQSWIWGRQYLRRASPEGRAGTGKKRT